MRTLEREINAQPWDPPPGLIKHRCDGCGYFCAMPAPGLCADCQLEPYENLPLVRAQRRADEASAREQARWRTKRRRERADRLLDESEALRDHYPG